MTDVSTIAQALGITPRACAQILREEAADLDDAQDALRRVLRHRAYLAGAVRSPGAFFRGVLRRVQDDRKGASQLPKPAPPPSTKQNAQPASPLGRAYLCAYHLLAAGTEPAAAAFTLRQDFPDASPEFLQAALAWAVTLRRATHSQLP